MLTIFIIIVAIMVFIVGIVSPYLSGKIQRKTHHKTNKLKQASDWLWDPLTWWAKITLEFIRKAIIKSSDKGKKTRRKL